mmetsp:Transcript_21980/g.54397  ORF Transcript_21980/g.54397 Transcript_21980/m.54397 type:complete len:97 (+) Transcript_21980:42-332(+)
MMNPISNEEISSTECKVVRLAGDGIDQSNFLLWDERCDIVQFGQLLEIVWRLFFVALSKRSQKEVIIIKVSIKMQTTYLTTNSNDDRKKELVSYKK